MKLIDEIANKYKLKLIILTVLTINKQAIIIEKKITVGLGKIIITPANNRNISKSPSDFLYNLSIFV